MIIAAGRRATQVRLLSLEGTVKAAKQGFGFIRFQFKGSDEERSVFFHSSEVEGGLALKAGDVVTFGLFDNPKTKELNARHVVRTQVGINERSSAAHLSLECLLNV